MSSSLPRSPALGTGTGTARTSSTGVGVAPGSDVSGSVDEAEAVAAEVRNRVGTVPLPPLPTPTCPICSELWTEDGDHRICCIPCGHVYGRSCLERLVHSASNKRAKCTQCGERFEHKLIMNIFAPINLWDELLQEKKVLVQSVIDERFRSQITEFSQTYVDAMLEHIQSVHAELKAVFESDFADFKKMCSERRAQMEETFNEQLTLAKTNLMLMKEGMKKMAKEKKAAPMDLIEFIERNCPQLSPITKTLVLHPYEEVDADINMVDREALFPNTTEAIKADSPDGDEAEVFMSVEMEEAVMAEVGYGVEVKLPVGFTCSVCMKFMESQSCIPCGHVYGRSCLESWLHRSGNKSAKCPQCGKRFESKLIADILEPKNLWDGWLQEVGTNCRSLMHAEFHAELRSKTEAKMLEMLVEIKFVRNQKDKTYKGQVAQMHRTLNEQVTMVNASLMLMKERMKKMAEEEKAPPEDLIEFFDRNCPLF